MKDNYFEFASALFMSLSNGTTCPVAPEMPLYNVRYDICLMKLNFCQISRYVSSRIRLTFIDYVLRHEQRKWLFK